MNVTLQLRRCLWLTLLAVMALGFASPAPAQEEFDPENPYKVEEDGTVDWRIYSGYRRYHADCHVCHGPDGMGSSFGPAMVDSLKRLTYDQYAEVVVNGRKNVTTSQENVMPAFGTNPNVMCFLDDIYAYLKARSDGAVPRGRPAKHADKSEATRQYEAECLGS